MCTKAPGLFKEYSWDSKKPEIKYAHTYGDSKDTIEILDKNILYFEL
jgi:hypothetical protein